MAKSGIVWKSGKSPRDLAQTLEKEYGVAKHVAEIGTVAAYWAPRMEEYAKATAPWHDWTTNARQGLFGLSVIEGTRVTIYLSHGEKYGEYLELCNSGRYAIIMPTLEGHYGQIMAMLRAIYK